MPAGAGSPAELAELLTLLRQELAGREEELPEASAAAAELAGTLDRTGRRPRSRMRELLAVITGAAGSAVAVAEAAEAIGRAIG
jgi:uncharacterized protein (DUF697 family)